MSCDGFRANRLSSKAVPSVVASELGITQVKLTGAGSRSRGASSASQADHPGLTAVAVPASVSQRAAAKPEAAWLYAIVTATARPQSVETIATGPVARGRNIPM